MILVPLFSAVGAKMFIGLVPARHAGPHSLVEAFAGFRRKRLWHDLFHDWTGNNILRWLGGETGLTHRHGSLRPVVDAVQERLR
jgi:hypothetical protein